MEEEIDQTPLADRIQHLMPAFGGGNDFVGIGGPDEGPGCFVCLCDEAIDGGLEIDHRAEDTALEPATREFGEVVLDSV